MITEQQEGLGRWIVLLCCCCSAPISRPEYAVATHAHPDDYELEYTVADIQRQRKHIFMMDFQAQTIQRRLCEI